MAGISMGLGAIGGANVLFKRKFRWTFNVDNICKAGGSGTLSVPSSFVKVAARPNLEIEETQIDYLNAKTWIPGKGTWNTIQVTYYDIAYKGGAATGNENLFTWLAGVYDFTNPGDLHQNSATANYSATGTIKLYDGCGNTLETWTLGNMWPTAIEFGELDYAASETVEIALTLRYTNVKYVNNCGPAFTPPCIDSCSSSN
jgi:hypothetical protein